MQVPTQFDNFRLAICYPSLGLQMLIVYIADRVATGVAACFSTLMVDLGRPGYFQV